MGCCAFSLNGSFDCFFSSLFWVLRFLSFGGGRRRRCNGCLITGISGFSLNSVHLTEGLDVAAHAHT